MVAFVLEFDILALITIAGILNYIDPVTLIGLTVLGLTGLGLSLALVVSWIPGWPYSEPLALGIIAAALGALCFPALHQFTKPLEFPIVNGAALLFATGPQNDQLTLTVDTDPLGTQFGATRNVESYSIDSQGGRPVRWALLLTGDARINQVHLLPQIKETVLTSGTSQIPPSDATRSAQLFFGTASITTYPTVSGTSVGAFTQSTSDSWAVSLPFYSMSASELLPTNVAREVTRALAGTPTFRAPSDFTMNIDAGFLPPSYYVSQAAPALTPDANDQNELLWTTHSLSITPSVAVGNDGAADITSDILFVFAILLGVAGAALLASMQSFIHILSSRKSTAGTAHDSES